MSARRSRGASERWGEASAPPFQRLFDPVDAASLAVFRIMFGLLMVAEVFRYFRNGWIARYFIEPRMHFTYLFFEWVRPWPGAGMYWHFAALGLLGALIALGLCYRVATVLFCLGFSYVFLLEQARYLNHFYLTCLVAFLLACTGANRWASLDRRLFGRGAPATVPFWHLFLLRAQLFLVYLYAGIAKLNPDWLRGEPVRSWLADRADLAVVGPLLTREWMVWLVAYGGLLFDLSIGFLLVWRRTRAVAVVLALLFHTSNNFLFDIGIFPYLAFAMTLLFLEPDWPRRLLRPIRTTERDERPGRARLLPSRRPVANREAPARREPRPPAGKRAVYFTQPAALLFVTLYLLAQTLLPLRHWLYPGDVNWTEEGHRFSWRMKLRSKEARLAVTLRDPATGREWHVDPGDALQPWQLQEMAARPDMILQYAHYVRHHARDAVGVAHPQVFVQSLCSLNGAPEQPLIDPTVDLAAEKRSLRHARWILPRELRTSPPPTRPPR